MRAVHKAKVGAKFDEKLIHDDTLFFFELHNQNQEQMDCLALRAVYPSSTPRPPSNLQIDPSYSPEKNTRMLANILKIEILKECSFDVDISVSFEIVDLNAAD